jgi:hypothetical protein
VLVYDTDYAVYAVSGYRNCYYYRGHYYRVDDGVWFRAASVTHPTWTVVSYHTIPPGLHKKYKQKYKRDDDRQQKKRFKGGDT